MLIRISTLIILTDLYCWLKEVQEYQVVPAMLAIVALGVADIIIERITN